MTVFENFMFDFWDPFMRMRLYECLKEVMERYSKEGLLINYPMKFKDTVKRARYMDKLYLLHMLGWENPEKYIAEMNLKKGETFSLSTYDFISCVF